jgi:hypothetical protein
MIEHIWSQKLCRWIEGHVSAKAYAALPHVTHALTSACVLAGAGVASIAAFNASPLPASVRYAHAYVMPAPLIARPLLVATAPYIAPAPALIMPAMQAVFGSPVAELPAPDTSFVPIGSGPYVQPTQNVPVQDVPEPGSLVLLLTAIAALVSAKGIVR